MHSCSTAAGSIVECRREAAAGAERCAFMEWTPSAHAAAGGAASGVWRLPGKALLLGWGRAEPW